MKKTFLILGVLVTLSGLFAGNSIFSYDGYPVQFWGRDIYSMGMGDTGASDMFRINNGYANPAMHNDNNLTYFSTGLILGYTRYKSETEAQGKRSFTDNSLDLPYFSMSVPLKKHRIGFQFNSYASGLVTNQTSFYDSTLASTITEQQSMDRYLYRGDLVYSFRHGGWSMGVSGNYYFGHETRSFVQNSGSGNFDTREQLIKSYKNPTATFGIIRSFKKLSLGINYTLPVTLRGDQTRTSIHETETSENASFELPSQLCASLTALPLRHIKLSTDLNYEDWSKAGANYGEAYKLGLGIAYEPVQEEFDAGWGRLPYRAGISYRKLPFKDSDGNEINELGLSAGLTIPLKNNGNRFDLGFQYTKRGSLGTNGLEDQAFMMLFGFTGFDVLSKAPDRKAPREIPEAEEITGW
ncbi:MAG: hypothetical protein CVU49_00505 [Candidatus Cloacimonetes bacterium HGW-Cloacimonetes-2]|jgi:hypothetical protein|nr:MAG: hypothetical protein CVU49_00505 [Candidatus Cloacimonetes bacterium HGW-Cloacimonetes-2]